MGDETHLCRPSLCQQWEVVPHLLCLVAGVPGPAAEQSSDVAASSDPQCSWVRGGGLEVDGLLSQP